MMNKKRNKIFYVISSLVIIIALVFSPFASAFVVNASSQTYSYIRGSLVDSLGLSPRNYIVGSESDGFPFIVKPFASYDDEGAAYWYYTSTPLVDLSSDVLKDYPLYVTWGDSGVWRCTTLPQGSFLIGNKINNGSGQSYSHFDFNIYVPKDFLIDNNISQINCIKWDKNGSYSQDNNTVTIGSSQERVVDGDTYYLIGGGLLTNYQAVFETNMPCYVVDDFSTFNSTSGLSQVNPNYSGGSTPTEDHETLREGSGIYLDNTTCNDGTVYVVAIPDSEQTTANGYKLRYTVNCSYVVNVKGNPTNLPIKTTLSKYGINAQIGNNTLSGAQYYYNDYTYQDINIDTIASDGIWTEDFKVTNERLKYNGKSISDLASRIASDTNWADSTIDGVASGVTSVKGLSIYGIGSIDIDTSSLASFLTDDYSVSSISYSFTLSLIKNGEVVAQQVYPYDLTGSGAGTPIGNLIGSDEDYESAGTKGMSDGEYNQDYAPANDVSVTTGGSSSGSSSSSNNPATATGGSGGDSNNVITGGDNNTVVTTGSNTNNVTVNTDNGTAKYLPTIISKLFPDSNGDGGLTESVQGLVNSNGWIDLMSDVYGFMPANLWNTLEIYFVSCLGILACAFFLRILLDIL